MKKKSKSKSKKIKVKTKKIKRERTPLPKDVRCGLGALILMIAYLAITLPIHFCFTEFTWNWFCFGLFFILIPCSFVYIKVYFECRNQFTEEQIKRANIRFGKYIFFYWFADCVYMVMFNQWLVWTYILGMIALLIIFYNLIQAFLGKRIKGIFNNFCLILDFSIGIVLSISLIYQLPAEQLQTIVTGIIAAIFGGLFTLVGVAWTIKKGDEDRKPDLDRLENERREEDRKRYAPYLKVVKGVQNGQSLCEAQIPYMRGLDLSKPEELERLERFQNETRDGYYYYDIKINQFIIRNVSTNILLLGIWVNDKYYEFQSKVLITKDESCIIHTTKNDYVPLAKLLTRVELVASDILGNTYLLTCQFKRNYQSDPSLMDEGKFVHFICDYDVISISLPVYTENTNE